MTHAERRTLVLVPTYNERENAPGLARKVLDLGLGLDLLFVDDASPDGTGDLLDAMAAQEPRIQVLHRPGRQGIGGAHLDGIAWARARGYAQVVTMDCDFTHPPEKIPEVLALAGADPGVDVIVGSRFLAEGSLPGWNLLRRTLTWTGHVLTKGLLGMPWDATGGFRFYRLERIPAAVFERVQARGYAFFFESLHLLHNNGFTIREVPICLPARILGSSKMSLREAARSLALLRRIAWRKLLHPEQFRVGIDLQPAELDPSLHDDQGWEDYWREDRGAGGRLYQAIAGFYRRFIIRPHLNRHLRRHFRPGTRVLHAGCGGGGVDRDVVRRLSVTALDISVNALNSYRRTHGAGVRVLHGSLFRLPLPDASLEGAYNLGVMEHFTEEEIGRILAELARVLKPGGRFVAFWPPEFGSSVLFLKLVKRVLALAGRGDVKLHPDEVSRVRSRAQVVALVEAHGFRVVDYAFGPGDLFTQVVVAAEKPAAAVVA